MSATSRDTLREGMRETVLQSLETGAPGLSAATRQAIARSIILKVEGRVLAPILDKADSAEAALQKINGIRNSIIGLQTMDWSEHIYPLVAALNAAGLPGMSYPEARENYGTMLERAVAAEASADRLSAEVEALREALKPFDQALNAGGQEWPDDAGLCRGINFGHLRAARTALARAAVKAEMEGGDHV